MQQHRSPAAIPWIFPILLAFVTPPALAPQREAGARVAPAPERAAVGPAEALEGDPCLEEGLLGRFYEERCARLRRVYVDFLELGILERPGGAVLRYDFDEVTRPLSLDELPTESELSVAVRLVISEVGADRMLASRFALMEAVGIIATVDHRLDPAYHDPEDRPESPDFPGCGPEGTFATCAEPSEYYGLLGWRGLDPGKGYPPQLLEEAVDQAVIAWYLWREELVEDPTDGAVSYVHRCGGAAYGEPTWRCDAHMGRPARDIPGANPHTGPIVFRAPTQWLDSRGWYALSTVAIVPYESWEAADWELEEAADAVVDAESSDDPRLSPASRSR